MKAFSRIWFPAAVVSLTAAGIIGLDSEPVHMSHIPAAHELQDTVIYPEGGYKLRRTLDLEAVKIDDSLLLNEVTDSFDIAEAEDTLPHLTARDTIKVPDSLRFSDPFRFKYYVALIDSLTHTIVRDSLKHSEDSLKKSVASYRIAADTTTIEDKDSLLSWALRDSVLARLDSLDWRMIDSVYFADSTAAAKAAFDAWYASLDRRARKQYDAEQLAKVKLAEMDSLKKVKEDKKALKDSIIENTPRILETFAIPDSLYYKRIIHWTVDQDFHKMDVSVPDTTYNYHFYDFPFQRKDVNSSWLGVSGSPVQYYNWFKRKSDEGVEFYDALEPWSYSPRTLPHYNSKTPYTELCYFGTLMSKEAKESDNLHLFTTQNITPAFNFSLLFDRFGGGGFLQNETTANRTLVAQANYLGKRYLMHAGAISNNVTRGENGGMVDNMWIRDTTLDDSREIRVNLANASSKTTKRTYFLEQQYRIPFNFINRMKARADSSFVFNADSLDTDITTAFIGHSSELSTYTRSYNDKIGDDYIRNFYHDVVNYDINESHDTLKLTKFDNKVFLRLQPWAADGIISKLDLGVGDYIHNFRVQDPVTGQFARTEKENSFYLYAGAEGQVRDMIHWDAKADYVLLGHDFADFGVQANAGLTLYPFRRARKSPLSMKAHFETTLREPSFYQDQVYLNHYSWDNHFAKISTTRIEGSLDIPRWKMDAFVGYALLGNNIYHDTQGIVRQNGPAMSVLSASLRKEFVLGPIHLDNRALAQVSSNQDVLPLPALSLNLRYFFQFVVQKDESRTNNVMEMQIGVNALYNTAWYAPSFNPNLGVFCNQTDFKYNNGPYFDAFINVQWKRACIFIKYQNMGMGWPLKKPDYFSAHNYILTQSGGDGLKLGLYWPFYTQPGKASPASSAKGGGSSSGRTSPGGAGPRRAN